MESHVVVIFPHPDDEAFGAAGTITHFREQGVPVTYLCGTLGEMGRNMGNPTFATRESLPHFRKEELIAACDVLDIDLHMLGYRDKTLEFESKDEIATNLLTYLEALEPSLVITHYPGHAVHPDHNAFGAATIEAIKRMEISKRPKVWAQAITNTRFEDLGQPDVSLDITPYFTKKFETILAHQSQAAGVLGDMDPSIEKLADIIKTKLSTEQFYTWHF
ncbi:1D-myo-inositol 2-acetamido-2-deoxy-alpha-D-glucopyranoside deacetylase [Paraliobacillus sp. PM-2]|uniref:bacillithiol biosynthesis deacetylase BshB2 n=1 Tax=Paraliobacillus sp. PM-2 TaxID=1462524 RepID=UPI00061C1E1A|nr:bacillithiol biosynthesis deacetylase BshB2 [Paraliobacillus sp. PM-2]CQR46469.1 1D-myo-inositol 2-acetamido-2-deoxy-alpha-D-glucopyranoside deacetylase [Paraliobacillus sp. PM-2]